MSALKDKQASFPKNIFSDIFEASKVVVNVRKIRPSSSLSLSSSSS